MTDITIIQEKVSTLIPLRREILRPDESDYSRCKYDGDHDARSLHIIASSALDVVGMASLIISEKSFYDIGAVQWRIRGVGVKKPFRQSGIASKLLMFLIRHVEHSDFTTCWLSARTTQRSLYERLGFQPKSEVYDIPGTGPHIDFVRLVVQDQE